MLSKPYFERIPAHDLIAGRQGDRYDYLAATKGRDYAFIYTCNGSPININLEKMHLDRIKASWYNPRNGKTQKIGAFETIGTRTFDPPGEKEAGNDWVLILDNNKYH
jgi:hypothetical protein